MYENEVLAIVGSNGCGKSTLLKVICGLLNYKRGKIYVGQVEIKKDKNLFDNFIAYLPQDPTTLFLKETVREELDKMCIRDRIYTDSKQNIEKEDFIVENENKEWIVVFDPQGTLNWKEQSLNNPRLIGKNVVVILLNNVSMGYLDHLKELGISYILGGETKVDLHYVMAVSYTHLAAFDNVPSLAIVTNCSN